MRDSSKAPTVQPSNYRWTKAFQSLSSQIIAPEKRSISIRGAIVETVTLANFVSFAQNAEDVMLWRALDDVEHGFYIDLGAGDPERDSVTAAFYSRGWRGLNVEPNVTLHKKLCDRRPEDFNLNLAVGAEAGEITLFMVDDDDRLSTTQQDVAARHDAAGHGMHSDTIAMRPLQDLCAEYVRGPIHFLKIDVEGAEADVLRGADFTRWRPWLVVVEAIDPTTLQPSHSSWEGLLLETEYHFVYFDGLNRFYAANEHSSRLDHHFLMPPNVRDAFIRNSEAIAMDLHRIQAEHAAVAASLHDQAYRLRVELEACIASREDIVHAQDQSNTKAKLQIERTATEHAEVVAHLNDETYRLKAEHEACILSREGIEASRLAASVAATAEIDRLRQMLQARSAERDGWMQELFETNRHAAYLAHQRQNLLEQISNITAHNSNIEKALAQHATQAEKLKNIAYSAQPAAAVLRQHASDLEAERDALRAAQHHIMLIRRSTSWRLTLPLRVLRRWLAGRRRI